MEDINLHFNGDLHAVTYANDLLSALIDNHIMQGNELGIDKVVWTRCIDLNDRALRVADVALGGVKNGVPRRDGFVITAASEMMAILCLADSLSDLKRRLGNILIGYDKSGKEITVSDLACQDSLAILLKDALNPNLVQTLEGTPAIVHGGPFANIAHGCNTVTATKFALKKADYVVTEAGFGADLGAEKFLDIKCRAAGLKPEAVVIVATIRSLKYHGGVKKDELTGENLEALEKGFANLQQHIKNMREVYKIPAVVAVNRFPFDTEKEIELCESLCEKAGAKVALSEVFAKGGEGGETLAKMVLEAVGTESGFDFCYETDAPIKEKIETIAKRIYHADGVAFTKEASSQIRNLEKLGYGDMPVCIAKTQYSFSDNQNLLAAPKGFEITVREVKVSAGAGFVVAMTGAIMKMPGLPKAPSAEVIDIDEHGVISGLF